MKILVIDDNEGIRTMLEFVFLLEGFETHFASDGTQGLELVSQVKPDVIVLDIMMPDMSGHEVAAILAQDEVTARIPILICSALADDKDIWDGWAHGASSYVSKPFDSDQLVQEIMRIAAPVAA